MPSRFYYAVLVADKALALINPPVNQQRPQDQIYICASPINTITMPMPRAERNSMGLAFTVGEPTPKR